LLILLLERFTSHKNNFVQQRTKLKNKQKGS
jgi:hypothetical protein